MKQYFFILFITASLFAEGSVNVTVDRRKINEGESVTLNITAEDIPGDPEVSLPKMDHFKVVSGPNQSSSTNIQFVNGRMTSSSVTTLTWTLTPTTTGKLTIPALTIKAGKQNIKSAPISITVSKRGTQKGSTIPQFFIEAELDNPQPFRGEQVILTYTLYTKVDVTSFDDELPKFKGFWTEELFAPKNLSLREIQKNGSRYYAATIKKLALFPTQSGEIRINPMTAVIGIRERQQRWNDFSLFGPPSKKYTVSTNALELNVQPLPNRPKGDVSAVVGNWNIRSTLSSSRVKQDKAITYQVVIKGTGNIQSVDISDISFPNELEVFEPEIQTKENPLRDKIGGEKIFEWVLIPRFAGEVYLPSIQFNFFDPVQGDWITKSTPRHLLKISPNEKAAASSIGLTKDEVALMGQDIRFMDESIPKWRNKNQGLLTVTALSFLLLSGMVFAFPYARDFTQGKLNMTSSRRKARRAIKSAFEILDSKDTKPEKIYTQIYQAIVIFMNMKTGLKQVEYSKREITNVLNNKQLVDQGKKIEEILTRGEAVRFASLSSENAQADLNEIRNLLKEIDYGWL